MTIKWVQVDPLVLNGEPFCYGSRVTVRQLLEMRAGGMTPGRILVDHPELRSMGLAAAFCFAVDHPDRYADFLGPEGSLLGPGYAEEEAVGLPEQYRRPGVVIQG